MRRTIYVAVGVNGFAVMGAEVAAGRLLAPSFGTSTLVWSALIGVVLGSLAVGALLGGRWSRRPGALGEVFAAIAVAGCALIALPSVTRPLMRATLESFMGGHLLGLFAAFAAVLALLALPVIVLGAASPVLVHHVTLDRDDVGRTAGRVSAIGTMGSLAGTFLCGVVLVPTVGTSVTFATTGALAMFIGLMGAAVARREARRPVLGRGSVAFALALAIPLAAVILAPHASSSPGAVVERETQYNALRVVDDPTHRTLYLNEGYAAQTITRHDGRAYLRGVWGYYAAAPAFTRRPPGRILVIGLGGGSSARDYVERIPGVEVVAVEIDPGVVRAAKEQFGLPGEVEVHADDARTFLARDARRYDLIVVDAFQFPYIPFQLATQEFDVMLRDHLREGGALMVNVGRKNLELDVVHAVASTLGTVFEHVSGVNVARTTNTILVATSHPLSEAGGPANVRFSAAEQRELSGLAPMQPWVVPERARLVLTDDRAPVEWLTNRIIYSELKQMAMKAL